MPAPSRLGAIDGIGTDVRDGPQLRRWPAYFGAYAGASCEGIVALLSFNMTCCPSLSMNSDTPRINIWIPTQYLWADSGISDDFPGRLTDRPSNLKRVIISCGHFRAPSGFVDTGTEMDVLSGGISIDLGLMGLFYPFLIRATEYQCIKHDPSLSPLDVRAEDFDTDGINAAPSRSRHRICISPSFTSSALGFIYVEVAVRFLNSRRDFRKLSELPHRESGRKCNGISSPLKVIFQSVSHRGIYVVFGTSRRGP
ncbi:hypothetical protein DFH07DRAFT_782997 [Mycena maculata]|uniref:Uncharacterized protein n=1 Tax=Mycena maculata TaxID=230809 RepID=A0AAD7HQX1_9AGAR|nr:hypothetical protein DFH07DRAFT_782997 [Mycena maculata]